MQNFWYITNNSKEVAILNGKKILQNLRSQLVKKRLPVIDVPSEKGIYNSGEHILNFFKLMNTKMLSLTKY